MELLYIWIKKYKGISDIGINLSNQYRFDYNQEEQKITIKAAENYIPGFFGSNISNLTGLIGENGTGKTSILRYAMQYLSSGNSDTDEGAVVLFYGNQRFYYYSTQNIAFYGLLIRSMFKRVDDLSAFKFSTSLVFVSNYFDPTSIYSFDYAQQQLGGTKNLSTNYLLVNDIQRKKKFNDVQTDKFPFLDHLNAFSSQEFIRIVRLLRWINQKEEQRSPFPAKLPPYINLKLYYNEDSPNAEAHITLRERMRNHFKRRLSKRDQFIINVFEAGLFNLIDEKLFVINQTAEEFYPDVKDIILDYINRKSGKEISDVQKEISDIIKYVKQKDEFNTIGEKLDNIDNLISQLRKYLEAKDGSINSNQTGFSVSITKARIGSLIQLIDKFYAVERIGDYADFYFSHLPLGESSLSSGEYSLMSIFGRLNELSIEKSKDILLLIDEAELALHPEWQKLFIDQLTDFVNERFRNYKVQVLLTSHSPFILSDLPPHCVILLKKQKKGESYKSVIVDSLESRQETFGANIHELFTDSFFLKDALMGEFAKKKINDLIKEIKDEGQLVTTELFDSKYKRRIDIIGEPFLRTKILELVAARSSISVVDRLIAERNTEIDRLNQIRNSKEDDQNR